ncbi:hypothetical protein AB1Y20_002042 [Prymnesium parvum]|uniref:Rubredoxin-like domain-containing protein n=1 Tax=Prymnesium parvum TaxID=97485 RepID=A0AB34JA32_PRYPA|mmetsp:Transcript_36264/g.90261  ORF Transcript_36264/g.90261 Transcript_36264/m.90261 type:complete len:184 (+) Transcript_36264:94-645(+)|eukprot:CAMPEP_0182815994 /NCGR_PEP_ID=MMETSP0006_2-20121128/10689_1 /TAXON_ID=97485 /ORGANISM="Prymnesium parvum, Strain Texoma1" /LENGTH=183 /DNA_ID=CAMNT_0024942233 /DNA_START=75 /DNA_END=626 /DNA_ORIENTATION=+
MTLRTLLLLVLGMSASVTAWTTVTPPHLPRALQRSVLRMAGDKDGFTFDDPEVSSDTVEAVEEVELSEKQKEIARLRAAEKFMKKETGDAVCRTCGYKFKMEVGERLVPRNTPFQLLPDSYVCPNCNSPKAFFDPVQIEIAGFADNQQYGLGTNSWTEAQKSTAIFGGLGLFVLLFLSGYALN